MEAGIASATSPPAAYEPKASGGRQGNRFPYSFLTEVPKRVRKIRNRIYGIAAGEDISYKKRKS
jgi:hypothetical protein